VVNDFHFHSLRSPVGPLVMGLRGDWLSTINIKVNSANLQDVIRHIEAVWNKICPDFLFSYTFLDANYEQLYNDEMRLGRIFVYLAVLAIFIACIGLLGLSSFLAEQRIKEIGIRKALGDTTGGIARSFSREFAVWVLISGFIAAPLAGFVMNKWLNNFAYRVHLDAWIMTGSCLLALAVALITVYAQTHRIASRNPVEALHYE
jgi:putative ABC transport system permease protein